MFVDTHTHLYLPEFEKDIEEVVDRAIENGIERLLLPNVDSSTIKPLLHVTKKFPGSCLPMMGLHPTSVKENYIDELKVIESSLKTNDYIAIGEIGIDLYWDTSTLDIQKKAFKTQLQWAKRLNKPVVIHVRNSFNETFEVLEQENTEALTGVFHCFSGNTEQAERVISMGFKIGIGGMVTFKNSGLDQVVGKIDLDHIVLETDAPYLAPVPYRGKRNESAYIKLIAQKISEIKNITIEEVAETTTNNALNLFGID